MAKKINTNKKAEEKNVNTTASASEKKEPAKKVVKKTGGTKNKAKAIKAKNEKGLKKLRETAEAKKGEKKTAAKPKAEKKAAKKAEPKAPTYKRSHSIADAIRNHAGETVSYTALVEEAADLYAKKSGTDPNVKESRWLGNAVTATLAQLGLLQIEKDEVTVHESLA